MPSTLSRALVLAASIVSADGLLMGRMGAGTAASAEIQEDLNADSSREGQPLVWVHAYARSGSSTILSMVSLESHGTKTFSLFEPCHPKDRLGSELKGKGCASMLRSIRRCDFSAIEYLEKWNDVHTKKGGATDYSPKIAGTACNAADKITLKTITTAFNSATIKPDDVEFIERNPSVRMVDVIRDPRSIFASWLTTWPFNDTNLGGVGRDTQAMIRICGDMAANLKVNHPRIHRLVFEKLVQAPFDVLRETYAFLQFDVTDEHHAWVNRTFNAKDCPGIDKWIAPYSDCHTSSDAPLRRWQITLTQDEQKIFSSHPECQEVAKAYGFPL